MDAGLDAWCLLVGILGYLGYGVIHIGRLGVYCRDMCTAAYGLEEDFLLDDTTGRCVLIG